MGWLIQPPKRKWYRLVVEYWFIVLPILVVIYLVTVPKYGGVTEAGFHTSNKVSVRCCLLGVRVSTDENGALPDQLEDIYPEYMDQKNYFFSKSINKDDHFRSLLYWKNDLTDTPIIMSQHSYKDKHYVGFRDGSVSEKSAEEFRDILQKGAWQPVSFDPPFVH